MAELNVPERYRASLAAIRTLDATSVAELETALRAAPKKAEPKEIAAAVAKGLRFQGAESLVEALASLYAYRGFADASVDNAVAGVLDAMGLSDPAHPDAQLVAERLRRLLGIEALQVTFKAAGLAFEHDHVLSFAKVISDVRPVFGTDLTAPVCAVIVHTLNIHYFEAGEHKEFRVAFDAEDLRNMRLALDRAETKAASLKRMLDKAQVECQSVE